MRDLAHVAEVLLVRDEGSLPTVREVMVCESPVLTDPDPNRTGGQAPAEVFHNGESYRVVAVANQL